MTNGEWAIVFSTVMGPVLAVQAQKWIERTREREGRKASIFNLLMATRQSRLSRPHVEALNGIELAFYGRRLWLTKRVWRSAAEQLVLDRWFEYFRHFQRPAPTDQLDFLRQVGTGDELFINLLESIAAERRLVFDRERLRTSNYSPMGWHHREQMEQRLLTSSTAAFEQLSAVLTQYSAANTTSRPNLDDAAHESTASPER